MTRAKLDVRVGSRIARRFPVYGGTDAFYLGEPVRVRIHDLSASGLRVETQVPVLRAGDWLRVDLPVVGERLCQITWHNGEMAGAQFSEPLGLDDFMGVLDEMRDRPEAADGPAGRD